MQNLKQKTTLEVKLSSRLMEQIDKLLILLTFGVITGSFFLAAIIISSFNLAK